METEKFQILQSEGLRNRRVDSPSPRATISSQRPSGRESEMSLNQPLFIFFFYYLSLQRIRGGSLTLLGEGSPLYSVYAFACYSPPDTPRIMCNRISVHPWSRQVNTQNCPAQLALNSSALSLTWQKSKGKDAKRGIQWAAKDNCCSYFIIKIWNSEFNSSPCHTNHQGQPQNAAP